MAKEQKTSVDFSRMATVPNLQLFYKPISAMALINYTNHLLPGDEMYGFFDRMRQIMSKNLNRKSKLRREFWGILGKKIIPTTTEIFRLISAPQRIKFLFLPKYNFKTFLFNKLSCKEVLWAKKTLIPVSWHRIGHTQESFRIKKSIN